jgi:glutathione S-transferase
MRVYGHPLSSCTRKVLITLAEKDARADLEVIDLMAGAHKTADHRARHPFAMIPVLEDDGFVLYESRAILRYLDRRLPGRSLTPARSTDAARMDQWISVDQSYVAPHHRALLGERLLAKHDGREPDPRREQAAEEGLASSLGVVDRALAGSPYLAGDAFSLADISLLPYVASLPMVGAAGLLADLPNLRGWLERQVARDSWRRATAA